MEFNMDIKNNSSLNSGGFGELHPNKEENKDFSSSKRNLVNMNWFGKIAAVVNFFLTFFLIRSVYVTDFNVSWRTTASYLGFFVLASVYIISKQKRFEKKALIPGVLAVISSFSFALHGNYELNRVVFVMIIFLSGMYCVELTGSNIHGGATFFYLLDILHCEVFIPIRKIFLPLSSFLSPTEKGDKKRICGKRTKTVFSVIIGVLFAVLVLRFVMPLLLSSDSVFESFFNPIYSKLSSIAFSIEIKLNELLDNWNENFFFDILILVPTAVVAPYIFSVMFSFRHGVAKENNKDTSEKYKKLRFASKELISVSLGIISLVYLVYLLSQTAYLFGAFSGKLPGGVELSVTEYARRGFSDLMTIAVINFTLVFFSVFFSKREDGKLPPAVKWLDVFLCVFTVLFSVISISKILLYISSYGLTEKRLYVFAADVVLIGVFVSVIIRLFKEKFPYVKVIIVLLCSVVTLLGTLGADNLIAKYNTAAYLSGKHETVDYDMLYDFDEAGFESLLKIYYSDKSSRPIEDQLFNRYSMHEHKFDSDGNLKSQYKFDLFEGVDNLDEYRRFMLISKNFDFFVKKQKELDELINELEMSAYNTVKVSLKTEKEIKSISVDSGEETSGVQNADETALENEDYLFEFDMPTEKSIFEITVTLQDGKELKFVTASKDVTIRDSKKGKLILKEK